MSLFFSVVAVVVSVCCESLATDEDLARAIEQDDQTFMDSATPAEVRAVFLGIVTPEKKDEEPVVSWVACRTGMRTT